MKKKLIRICPVCEHKNGKILHNQKFLLPDHYPLPKTYDLVCCDNCGFVYADTSATQSDYDYFYQELSKYQDCQTSTGGGYSVFDLKRLQTTAEIIANFLTNKQKRILDIGCANGGLLNQLKKLGYNNLWGVDPSVSCIKYLEQNYNILGNVGSIFSDLESLGKFDFIILSHVLEHLQDLKTAIKNIVNLLNEQGTIYIEVPNASKYKDYVYSPFQDFNTEHINHFSHKCLINILSQFNLQLQEKKEKNLETAENCFYPVIYQFWQKTDFISSKIDFEQSLKEDIGYYIATSQLILNNVESKLLPLIENQTEILVWGTGQLAMKLLAETSLVKANIKAFIDGNPINQGKSLLGIEILAPDVIQDMKKPIVITSLLHKQAILNKIRNIGLLNEIIVLS